MRAVTSTSTRNAKARLSVRSRLADNFESERHLRMKIDGDKLLAKFQN